MNNRILFLTVLEAGVQDQGAGQASSRESSLPGLWTAPFSLSSHGRDTAS